MTKPKSPVRVPGDDFDLQASRAAATAMVARFSESRNAADQFTASTISMLLHCLDRVERERNAGYQAALAEHTSANSASHEQYEADVKDGRRYAAEAVMEAMGDVKLPPSLSMVAERLSKMAEDEVATDVVKDDLSKGFIAGLRHASRMMMRILVALPSGAPGFQESRTPWSGWCCSKPTTSCPRCSMVSIGDKSRKPVDG